MADIEIEKFYEVIRNMKSKMKFMERRLAQLTVLEAVTGSGSQDNSRINTHVGDRNIHFQQSGIEELNFHNGTFIEKFDAVVTSDGATITMSLEQSGTGDLLMRFGDGLTILDCTPALTIALTAGASDASPQANYIYVLQSDKILTKSTSGWPTPEHIKIGYFLVPTAGFVQTNNVYVNQNWNDFASDPSNNQGHLTHMTQRSRYFGAKYFSGVDPAGGDDYLTIGVGNTEFKSGAGVVWQMHPHTFGAFDTSGGDLVLVKNWNGDDYHDITDLFDIVDDSAGVSLANKWFTVVVWGVANKTGELDYIMINLPSGSYATEAKATEDATKYTDFSIPRAFSLDSSTGFLVAAIVVKQAATWLYGSTKDLRGISSAFAVAGATGTGITDHGSLTGLADDDHTQYVTNTATQTLDMDDNDIDNVKILTFNNQGAGGDPTLVSNAVSQLLSLTGALAISSIITAIGLDLANNAMTQISGMSGAGYSLGTAELGWLEDIFDTGVSSTEFDYLDGVTSNIQTQIDALSADLAIGSGNAQWAEMAYGSGNVDAIAGTGNGWSIKQTGTNFSIVFYVIQPKNLGGLALHLSDMRITLTDADGSNYVTRTLLRALNVTGGVASLTTLDDDTGNRDTIAIHDDYAFAATDVSAYERIGLTIQTTVGTADALEIGPCEIKYYYA